MHLVWETTSCSKLLCADNRHYCSTIPKQKCIFSTSLRHSISASAVSSELHLLISTHYLSTGWEKGKTSEDWHQYFLQIKWSLILSEWKWIYLKKTALSQLTKNTRYYSIRIIHTIYLFSFPLQVISVSPRRTSWWKKISCC